MAAKLQIIQRRSSNGTNRKQRETLRSLGLGRIGSRSEKQDTPQIRGMIDAVSHLVIVEGAQGSQS